MRKLPKKNTINCTVDLPFFVLNKYNVHRTINAANLLGVGPLSEVSVLLLFIKY